MIALRDGMPLIALPDGRNATFDKRWIMASLRNAADHAGYERWWLAGHIAESVTVYLKRDFDENFVSVTGIESAVVDVLETLGFSDVAVHFKLPDPPLTLSLADLVREAGEGYELAFFGLLGQRIQCVAGSQIGRLEIRDLSACLNLLERRSRRLRRQGLREEIVAFIRQQGEAISATWQREPLEIQLS